jgi:peptide/nickel transport system permease protein
MTEMLRYILRRLAYAVFVVWAAYTLTFVFLYLLPSNPVSIMLANSASSGGSAVGAAQRAALEAQYGFNKPVVIQYLELLSRAVRGNFGTSIISGQPVVSEIGAALWPTLAIMGLGTLMALAIAALITLGATYGRFRPARALFSNAPALLLSFPTFWLGVMAIEVLSAHLRLFPSTGNSGFRSDVLPALVIALPTAALFAQVLIKAVLDTAEEPFVLALRAKGISDRRLYYRHILRNALVGLLTVVGVVVGTMVAGAVVTETVFARNGIGRVLELAVTNQDIPVVQGVVALTALAVALVNLVVDVLYPLLDPRIRPQGAACRLGAAGILGTAGGPEPFPDSRAVAGGEGGK